MPTGQRGPKTNQKYQDNVVLLPMDGAIWSLHLDRFEQLPCGVLVVGQAGVLSVADDLSDHERRRAVLRALD
jgi:hypothetical protein